MWNEVDEVGQDDREVRAIVEISEENESSGSLVSAVLAASESVDNTRENEDIRIENGMEDNWDWWERVDKTYSKLSHYLHTTSKLNTEAPNEWMAPLSWLTDTKKQQCGAWMEDYAKFHADTLSGKLPPRFVVSQCPKNTNCGGLADRLLAISSAFLFGLVTRRALLINWETDVQPEWIFDAPKINWSYDVENSLYNGNANLSTASVYAISFGPHRIDPIFQHRDWNATWQQDRVDFIMNRGIVHRTFNHSLYGESLLKKQFGLSAETAFACFMNFLIRPKPKILSYVKKYLDLLSRPNVLPIGIQIRTGDASMRYQYAERNGSNPLDDSMFSVENYKEYFRCAGDLVSSVVDVDGKKIGNDIVPVFFFITDSAGLRDSVARYFGENESSSKILVTGLPIAHMHKFRNSHLPQFDLAKLDALERLGRLTDLVSFAVVENFILSHLRFKIISQGGYGKLSAFWGSLYFPVNDGTVLLTPFGNTDLKRLSRRRAPAVCRVGSDPESRPFVTYAELASDWSLG